MDKVCSQCKLAFQAVRVTARYCSPACRNIAFRGVSVAKDSVAILSVARKAVSVPVVTDRPQAIIGLCHGCQEDVAKDCMPDATEAQKDHARELICICHQCIAKGVTHKSLNVECGAMV